MPASAPSSKRKAFSLIELLIVIAIASLVGVLVVTGVGNSQSAQLTASANQLLDTLSLAREVAIAKNQPVEVWFLKPKNEPFISSYQMRLVDPDGTTSAKGGLIRLATGIGIDTGSLLSSFVSSANTKQWGGGSAPVIGSLGTNYDCWYLRFQPNGVPTLSSSSQHYLTIHRTGEGNGLASLPANYAVIGISPATGKARVYRP
jgi:uncharacterized protein (TIGR02596 family)